MKDEYTGAIKYDGFKRANVLSEMKAKFVLSARKKIFLYFMQIMNPTDNDKVIDAGVAPVKGIDGVKTVTNNFFEMWYPYTDKIVATSIEDAHNLENVFKGLRFVQTEAYKTPFSDKEFDILFCNAVVEHTGSREQQKKFIHEYCRICKRFLFTTPNRWFPVEPHSALPIVHWLPVKMFRKILCILGKDALADESILNLLTIKEFVALFPDNVKIKVKKIRTCGMVSNLVIYGEWI